MLMHSQVVFPVPTDGLLVVLSAVTSHMQVLQVWDTQPTVLCHSVANSPPLPPMHACVLPAVFLED